VDFFAVEFDDGAGADFADLAAGGYPDVDGVAGCKFGRADAVGDFDQGAGAFHKGHGKMRLGNNFVARLHQDDFVDGGCANHD